MIIAYWYTEEWRKSNIFNDQMTNASTTLRAVLIPFGPRFSFEERPCAVPVGKRSNLNKSSSLRYADLFRFILTTLRRSRWSPLLRSDRVSRF